MLDEEYFINGILGYTNKAMVIKAVSQINKKAYAIKVITKFDHLTYFRQQDRQIITKN